MRNGMVILHKTGDMWAIKSIVALRTEFWYNDRRFIYKNLMLYKTMRVWKHMEVVRLSTSYYIFNRKKREEIQEFNRFWEETFIPGLKQQIEAYCGERNGTYVNPDFGNEIINEKISGISDAPGKSESYEMVIGVSHWNGKRNLFQWEGSYVEEHIIRDEASLVEFFNSKMNQQQYSIADEFDKEYTLDAFLNAIKYGGDESAS